MISVPRMEIPVVLDDRAARDARSVAFTERGV